jgi:hypothetical protein
MAFHSENSLHDTYLQKFDIEILDWFKDEKNRVFEILNKAVLDRIKEAQKRNEEVRDESIERWIWAIREHKQKWRNLEKWIRKDKRTYRRKKHDSHLSKAVPRLKFYLGRKIETINQKRSARRPPVV